MSQIVTNAIFYIFALLSVVSAIMVVTQKNVMHSVLYLAFAVLSISGIFFVLQADFLGAIQILVYAGGIVVLYIFVIIIVNLVEPYKEKRKWFPKLFIIAVPILFILEMTAILHPHKIQFAAGDGKGFGMKELSEMLLSTYIIPFEIASVLLLAVLVGAIIIARRKLLHDTN